MLKKRLLTAILAGITALTLTACGNSTSTGNASSGSGDAAASDELTTVRYAVMTNNQSQWYAVIGDETGIFADHGIEVKITEFAAGINTVDAIVTEQADIGILADYAAVNRIGNTQDNSNLRIFSRIATNADQGATSLYVNPDKVKSLEDLAGQGFATQPGTVWDYWVAKTYEKANIPEDQQVILNCDSGAAAVAVLTSGEGVAFWCSGTNAQKLEEAGFEPLITLDDLGLHTEQYNITSTSFLEEHQDIVEEFLLAQQEIAEWINANPEEAAQIIEEKTGNPADQFIADFNAITLTIDFTQDTLDHLNGIKDWAVGNGSYADYDILNYVDLSALEEVSPDSVAID
ncbi:MAG: ABC transporter substrate-binding protein [Clostridia bacterium]|nr:ABC transporter substrate-binding protein [Clostridia bacterium]